MERERDTESLLVFHLSLCHHIAISCLSLIYSNLKLLSSEASRSFFIHFCFHFSLFLSSVLTALPPPPCLGNVTISTLRTYEASPGHQSLRQSVSCLTVCQLADPSPSSHSGWITHSIARLIAQPLTQSVTFFFVCLFLLLPAWETYMCEAYRNRCNRLKNWLKLILGLMLKSQTCTLEQKQLQVLLIFQQNDKVEVIYVLWL